MKRKISLLVVHLLILGTMLGCSEKMDYTTAALSTVKEINALETKTVTIDAVVEFPQNPQYTSVVNSIWQTSVPSEYATILDLKINVPADGTYTGVSVRSESDKALSGHLGVFENGYVAAESETESILFAEFQEATEGVKFHELQKGSWFTFRLNLPPASYNAGDLKVRLHAAGNRVYEGTINMDMAVCGTYDYEIELQPLSGNNWISILPDNALVCDLSIPGTHDAATGDGTSFSLGKTQGLTLQEQWDMGIRMFDLRPGYKKVRSGWFKYVEKLHIYHGIVETKTSFESAIKTLVNNLKANPDEFAIIVMRFENDHLIYNDRDVWNNLMTSFLSSSDFPEEYRVDFRPDLTVGDLRGKILILSRDAYASVPSTGAFVSGWSHGENGSTGGTIIGKNSTASLNIQDYYSVEDSEQKNAVIKSFADMAANAQAGRWTINHTSGYTGTLGSDSAYKKNAANTNSFLYDYLVCNSKPIGATGIIVMDHVGSRKSGSYTVWGDLLPQAIIDNNYKHRLTRR